MAINHGGAFVVECLTCRYPFRRILKGTRPDAQTLADKHVSRLHDHRVLVYEAGLTTYDSLPELKISLDKEAEI